MHSLILLEPEIWTLTGLSQGVGVALSLGRGDCFPASSNFWWPRAFLLCGHSAPILHPLSHDHLISSLVCSQIALSLSFYKDADIYIECPSGHSRVIVPSEDV